MMTRLNKFGIIALVLLFFSSCRQKTELGISEYLRYLRSEKSGLISSKTVNNIKFRCELQPPELITLLHSGTSYKSQQDFETQKKSYGNQLNVVFLIEDETPADHAVKKTVFDEQVYSGLLSYANTGLQKDFSIQLPDGSMVPCSLVHIEAANSIQPVIRITVAFDAIETALSGCSLVFDDTIFNTGRMKFHYSPETLASLPYLKI